VEVLIASDHAGWDLKEVVKSYLSKEGVPFRDLGPFNTQSVDYPLYARALAREISGGKARKGILICGTGLGMSMAANRFPGVRAALCGDPFTARLSREHNDANVLCLGGRMIGTGMALEIVRVWLATPFEGGRHQRRVEELEAPFGDAEGS
jgi:ribose 5-phosphate isomerase B